uniref:PWI domain-containing protein n=1 Tax=Pseudo-nitzschia australis TaxID=44445 RepID=A0A7S4EGQ6_9STRA
MSTAPPPLPIGGPPPPLPDGLPPMPVGGLPLPPPNMGTSMNMPVIRHPPAPVMGGPPPMSHRGGGGGMGGRSPFTNTILITNIPPFFIGYQQVRDWLYPCGTAKTCLFHPRPHKRKKDSGDHNNNSSNSNSNSNSNTTGGDVEMVTSGEGGAATTAKDDSNNGAKNKTVLVNMINPDQAMKVVACFKKFSDKLDDRHKGIRCCMVPSSPDLPLPPPLVDETAQKVLGEKLWHNFVTLETVHAEKCANNDNSNSNTNKGTNAPTVTGDNAAESDKTKDADETNSNTNTNTNDNDNVTTDKEEDQNKPKLLDADKVAAAAGGAGAYDAEEDPLNAPQVLEAVKEFRRKLDQTHGSQKTQRMEMVAKKLGELRPKIRAQVDAETKNRRERSQLQRPGAVGAAHAAAAPPPPVGVALPAPPTQASLSLPQPPLPGGLAAPPPSLGLPLPPRSRGAVADSGKRGRSNLPAWMTQQQQQQGNNASTEQDPASKKAKTSGSASDYPSHFPSSLPPSSHAMLRQFLANQVKESMGEEEATLIDFLYNHILRGKATSELLQELQDLVEEEADGFLKAVWTKVQEIQQQQ